MKHLKKVLALCAIIVFVIAAVFALPACQKDPTLDSISVAIVGGGDTVQLEQNEASVEKISQKITVTAHYSDETTQAVTDYTIEGFDKTKLDTVQSLTVKYGELTAPLSVKIKKAADVEVTVTSITVTPTSVTLKKSEATAAKLKDELTVKAKKSDNTEVTVAKADYTVSTIDTTKATQNITVTYSGKTTTVALTIEDDTQPPVVTVTDITVTPATVTLQKSTASETTLKAALTVTATKSDESTETVTDYTVTALDTTKATQTVTVTYSGISKTVNVNIQDDTPVPVTVTGITVTPASVTLKKSEATVANLKEALTVKAIKSNETEETIAKADYTVSEIDTTQATQNITVTYSGKTATVALTIEDDTQPPVPDKDVYITINDEDSDVTVVESPDSNLPATTTQYKAVVVLAVDDEVVIKDAEGNTIKYDDRNDFNGTADKVGIYTFYIKVDENSANSSIWTEYKADAVKSLTTNVTGILSLPGVKANNIKGSLTVTATWTIAEEPSEVTDYTVTGYDKTKLNEEQTVTISYDGATVQIKVKAVEKSHVGISVTIKDDKDVITLIGAQATAENVLKEVTVKVIYNDGTDEDVTSECTVGDIDKTTTDVQDVLVSYEGVGGRKIQVQYEEATVQSLEAPASITVDTADETTIRSKLTVKAVMNDGTKPTVTDYEIEIKTVEGKTVATITYNTLTCDVAVTVLQAEPVSISVDEDSVTISEPLAIDADAISDYVKDQITVTLTLSDNSTTDLGKDDYTATYTKSDESDYAGKVTISYDGITETQEVAVTIAPVPKITVTRGDKTIVDKFFVAGTEENTYVSGNLELKYGDIIAITWKKDSIIPSEEPLTAPRTGTYNFNATVSEEGVTLGQPSMPEYAVTLTVKGEGKEDATPDLSVKTYTDREDGLSAEYYIATLELQANDVIEITDNEGNTIDKYEACGFKGTALADGEFGIYVKKFTDGHTQIYVAIPYYVLTTSEGQMALFVLNKDAGEEENKVAEYTCSLDLVKDESVTIYGLDRNAYYASNIGFNGSAHKDGNYSFYLKLYKDGGNTVWVNGPAPDAPPAPTTPTTVYYYNTKGWTKVYAYCWTDGADSNGWPGEEMTDIGNGWFSYVVQPNYAKIIFDNGNGGGDNQTGNLDVVANDGVAYYNYDGVTDLRPDAE